MSRISKDKKAMAMILITLMLAVTVGIGVFAINYSGNITLGESSNAPFLPPPSDEDTPSDEDVTTGGDVELEADVSTPEGEESSTAGDVEVEPNNNFQGVVTMNKPNEMRAAFLTPGEEYFVAGSDEATVKAEIDAALTAAKDLTMNTIVFETLYEDKLVYLNSTMPNILSEFDALEYGITKAREMGFFTYAVYHVNYLPNGENVATSQYIDNDDIDIITENLHRFAYNYYVDGIILDDYYNVEGEESYAHYLKHGGGMGYENYLTSTSEALFTICTDVIRDISPALQVGMMTESVWENQSANPSGSLTAATFTTFGTGNANNVSYIQDFIPDFVMVKTSSHTDSNSMNFSEIVEWWDAQCADVGMPLYVVHATSKACTEEEGWTEYDEIIKQVMVAEELSSFEGSAFDSLTRMEENPKEFTTRLLQYYNDEINPEHILKELAVTQPTKLTYETFEPTVIFMGASDPNEPVTFNGDTVETDENGYFSVAMDLLPGANQFVVEHKGKTLTYNITRRVVIIDQYNPTGSLTLDGGMNITVSAMAYDDANVTATFNGKTITLQKAENLTEDATNDTGYSYFEGEFTLPSATSNVQSLGNIVISGSWEGLNETKTGASVTVNKKISVADGSPIVVVADQAETFPTTTINNTSSPYYYPLPKGTLDFAVGDKMTYKSGDNTYSFYNLASGLRVYAADIQAVSDSEAPEGNRIEDVSVKSDSKYTYITFEMTEKVSYTAKYNESNFTVKFHYTNSVPNDESMSSNPMFSAMEWADETITIDLVKSGSFLGYTAYYSGDNLVFKFLNPPKVSSSSLKGVSIVIDPGHGTGDPGALGFLPSYPESAVNAMISEKLEDELKSRGATVYTLNTSGSSKMELASRMNVAADREPHILISVHSNSALGNSSAKGTEAYYFTIFSRNLSGYVSQEVAAAMNTTNRGGKYGMLYMTRDSRFASTLVEVGFMSNSEEYKKLISETYQTDVAEAIADGVYRYLSSMGGTSSGSASSNTGVASTTNSRDEIEEITLNEYEIELEVGETFKLTYDIEPYDAEEDDVDRYSEDTSIASISQMGTITAKSPGKTVIVVEAEEGDAYAECEVTVVGSAEEYDDDYIQEITLNKEDVSVAVGGTYKLSADIYPEDVKYDDIEWSSDDEDIATVSQSGTITGKKTGTTTIYVEAEDGDAYAECEVKVTNSYSDQGVSVTGIKLDDSTYDMYVDDEITLDYAISPSNASNKDVRWLTSDSKIVSIDDDGVLTAHKSGEVEIIVETVDGLKYDMCDIKVYLTGDDPVSSVELTSSSLTMLPDATEQLSYKVLPASAENKDVSFKSSNTSVAKVSSSGKITAVAAGTATITVTTDDGNETDQCTVTVKSISSGETAPEYIEVELEELYLYEGDDDSLNVEVFPSNTTDKELEFSIDVIEGNRPVSISLSNGRLNIEANSIGEVVVEIYHKEYDFIKTECRIIVEE